MTRSDKIKAEERFPISEQGYTIGILADGTQCKILLDTGASKSFLCYHIILGVNPCTLYQSFHLNLKVFKQGMDSTSMYYSKYQ